MALYSNVKRLRLSSKWKGYRGPYSLQKIQVKQMLNLTRFFFVFGSCEQKKGKGHLYYSDVVSWAIFNY